MQWRPFVRVIRRRKVEGGARLQLRGGDMSWKRLLRCWPFSFSLSSSSARRGLKVLGPGRACMPLRTCVGRVLLNAWKWNGCIFVFLFYIRRLDAFLSARPYHRLRPTLQRNPWLHRVYTQGGQAGCWRTPVSFRFVVDGVCRLFLFKMFVWWWPGRHVAGGRRGWCAVDASGVWESSVVLYLIIYRDLWIG